MTEKLYATGIRYKNFYVGMKREMCNEREIKLFDKLDCKEKDGILSEDEIIDQKQNCSAKTMLSMLGLCFATLAAPILAEDFPKLNAKHGGKIAVLSYGLTALSVIVGLAAKTKNNKEIKNYIQSKNDTP